MTTIVVMFAIVGAARGDLGLLRHLKCSVVPFRVRGFRMMEFHVLGERPSRDLIIFDTMLRAKPYPAESPFDERTDDSFAQRQTPWLLPQPSPAEAQVLSRIYTNRLASNDATRVLEVVGDGNSRVPIRQRFKRLAQLHTCGGSYAPFKDASKDEHALFCEDERLPFSDHSFDMVRASEPSPAATGPGDCLPAHALQAKLARPTCRFVFGRCCSTAVSHT